MEKTHHAAKAANQNHTQHSGTKSKTSAIVQQYEHWYRNIQHRFVRNERLAWERAMPVDQNAVDRVERRRVASNSPGVIEGRNRWRAQRVREGSRYVVREDPSTTGSISPEPDTQESPEPDTPESTEPDTPESEPHGGPMSQHGAVLSDERVGSSVSPDSADDHSSSIWELPVEDITS